MITRYFYHYAPLAYLEKIVESGCLRPSAAGGHADEPPLLWFSKEQVWEPTASKPEITISGLRERTFKQMREEIGCIRFGLPCTDKRLMDWRKSCKYAGISTAERKAMEQAGKERGGNPSHWFSVSSSILLSELSYEIFKDGKWLSEKITL